jgi:hypothetical protein
MKTRVSTRSLILLALIALLTSSSSADVLHDQSAIEPEWEQGFLNTIAGGGRTGYIIYGMSDVQVGGGGWIVESVTIYVQSLGSEPTTAFLNIFPKVSSPLPTVDQIPTQDLAVTVTTTLVPGTTQTFAITASGLNIPMYPGDYWIGLTPLESAFFYSTHAPAANQMYDNQASYDAVWGVWDNMYAPKDATILIEGTHQVVATEELSIGSVKALFR